MSISPISVRKLFNALVDLVLGFLLVLIVFVVNVLGIGVVKNSAACGSRVKHVKSVAGRKRMVLFVIVMLFMVFHEWIPFVICDQCVLYLVFVCIQKYNVCTALPHSTQTTNSLSLLVFSSYHRHNSHSLISSFVKAGTF